MKKIFFCIGFIKIFGTHKIDFNTIQSLRGSLVQRYEKLNQLNLERQVVQNVQFNAHRNAFKEHFNNIKLDELVNVAQLQLDPNNPNEKIITKIKEIDSLLTNAEAQAALAVIALENLVAK